MTKDVGDATPAWGRKIPPSNARNQLALRGDALTINACYTSGMFEAVAGMLTRILRECKTNNWPPDFNPPFVNLSLRLTSQTNKGSALYLSGIILQLVSRLSLVQFHFVS